MPTETSKDRQVKIYELDELGSDSGCVRGMVLTLPGDYGDSTWRGDWIEIPSTLLPADDKPELGGYLRITVGFYLGLKLSEMAIFNPPANARVTALMRTRAEEGGRLFVKLELLGGETVIIPESLLPESFTNYMGIEFIIGKPVHVSARMLKPRDRRHDEGSADYKRRMGALSRLERLEGIRKMLLTPLDTAGVCMALHSLVLYLETDLKALTEPEVPQEPPRRVRVINIAD